jgi:AbrB family looped-hinge helix DNA binding protein
METVKIGKKGQVTIPRRILDAVGIPAESTVIVEPEADGIIRLRPAAVYPIERYSDERIEEFEQENRLPPALERRVRQALNRDRT